MGRSLALLAPFLIAACTGEKPRPQPTGEAKNGGEGRTEENRAADARGDSKKVEEGATPGVFSGRLSAWKESGDFIGSGWDGPSGIIIDDTGDLSNLEGPERTVAENLAEELVPLGVTSCADFTYTRRDRPASITLRVFVFEDVDSARSWWKKKYESPAAKLLYREVDAAQVGPKVERALDSEQMRKRIALSSNVLFSCGQVGNDREHLKVLDRYLRKLDGSL